MENAKFEIVKIKKILIHTVSLGSDTNQTPILLLHGFPDLHYGFKYIMPILAEDRQVIIIDQRGYNKSSKPTHVNDYSLNYLTENVVEVIN